jgi:hypothetical protein
MANNMTAVAASVRVSGPPNSNFLVGYPGISATLVSAALRKPAVGRASIAVRQRM